jgi:hypothetical protein
MKFLQNIALMALAAAAVQFGLSSEASAQCTNACPTAHDGECDDGGPGSLYSICDYGTDCGDCGPRGAAMPVANTGCSNTCGTANDGECDDGGAGSLYSICDLGTDCNDCGPRNMARQVAPSNQGGTAGCTNTCGTSNDGECDDGGPGSMYSICDLGTDCNDCGARQLGAVQQQAAPRPNTICVDTCGAANDGECDDGGPNSFYDVCRYGTDCGDCGPRSPIQGCSNTCGTANDGECDDGGPNSMYSICDLGTDCADCGPR